MNPDLPHNSREELEAGLTALLLGELPPEQAAQLRRAIEQDAALAALHQRLKLTIDLVRETAVQPAGQTAAPPVLLKLSDRRRQELLAHFKTLTPKEFARPRRQQWRLPVLAAAAAMLVGLLALAVFLPALTHSRSRSLARAPAGGTPFGTWALEPQGQVAMLEERLPRGGQPALTPAQTTKNAKIAKTAKLGRGQLAPTPPEAESLKLADRVGTGSSPGQEPQSGTSYRGGAYWGYSSITPMPEGSPEWAEAKASRERVHAILAPVPSAAPASPVSQQLAAPITSLQRENGRESPRPAAGKRTAIVLPGSIGANETAAQTEAPFSHAGTPPSGGSSPSETAGQTQAASGGGPVVRTFNLSHADPKQLADQLSKLFPDTSRTYTGPGFGFRFGGGGPFGGGFTGNVHVASNTRDNKTSQVIAVPQPGANSVAVSADGQLMPHIAEMIDKLDVDARQEAVKVYDLANADPQDAKAMLQDLFQRSGNTRADNNNNRNSMMGTGNPLTVRSTQNQPNSWSASAELRFDLGEDSSGLGSRGGGGTPGGGGGIGGGVTGGMGGLEEARKKYGERYGIGGGTMGGMGGGMGGAPGERAAPPQLAINGITAPVEPGQPLTKSSKDGLGAPAAVFAATPSGSSAVLKETEAPAKPEAKPAQGGNTASPAAIAANPLQDQIPILGDKPGIGLGWRNENTASADAGKEMKAKDLPVELLLADSKAEGLPAQPPTATAPQGNKAASSIYGQGVTNIEQGLAGNGIAARYAYVVPSVTNAARKLEELERKGTTLEPKLQEGLAGLVVEQQRLAQAQEDAIQSDRAARKQPAAPAPIPQPEVQTRENAFSTFSLNVSDVSFKLAAASLEKGMMPEPAAVRSEEFINAFDYRDPEAPAGVPVAFACERARYPFAHNRDLLRFSLKTAAGGRQAGRALNIVLLLDTSGSMERADRVRIIHEALRVLAGQLDAQDTLSVVTFARTARLRVDGVPGSQAGRVAEEMSGLTPEGGTNLEEAMNLAYQTALRHYLANGINRVVLLTDGAANLGNVEPEALKQKVEAHRKQGIALDCFGIGWEGYNDDLLEVLSRNGDGRYGFLNTPEEAATGFAGQLAGALRVAASDVKVQVEFNPARVRAYRQLGYARHQLAKEQFRDNTVVAAQIGAAESGNALYVIETDPRGDGPLGVVRVRYRLPGTSDYREQEWTAPYTGSAAPLERASAALRLAAVAGAFSEWLASSPFAGEVTPERLLGCLRGVPEVYGPDARPRKLEAMIRQAQSLGGK